MTQRTQHGYQHPNAYRTWLPEHYELLRAVSLKGRGYTALSSTISLEALAVCLGRSTSSIAKKAQEIEVNILTQEQLDVEWAMLEVPTNGLN